MPTSLTTLLTQVTDAVAQTDTKTTDIATRGLNMGQLIGALLFKPDELNVSGNLTASAAGTSVSLSTLTYLHAIIDIYNTTGLCPVLPLPVQKWNVILPPFSGVTIYTKFYSRYGGTLWVNPPTADNTLLVKYFKLPTPLSSGSDELSYSNFDQFIVSCGIQFTWACKEEPDNAKAFQSFLDNITSAYSIGGRLRGEIEEVLKSGSYV